jgi:polyphosphate kinase 2 (PPK2 family)
MKRLTEPGAKVRLDDIPAEPPKGMTKEKAQARLAALGAELSALQDAMWGAKLNSVMVVLQGRDSAGKEHDFLWRVHRHAPRLGEFAIFNRSHYEDVLVVRVRGLAPKSVWKERYGHIADFEELLAEHGAVVLKFFLHITKKEQKERLLERERAPETAWTLNPNDWVERDYWDDYTEAYEDAISKTAAPHAPWIVVPANAKWYRNLVVAESIVAALRPRRRDWTKKLDAMGREGRAGLTAYRAQRKKP